MKQDITPKMIDWILYNMKEIRAQIEDIEPKSSSSVVVFSKQNTKDPVSGVEKVAIKRAALSTVLDAVEKGVRTLHPEQRKVYRMKYKAHMTYKQIGKKLFISEETVGRRINEVREIVKQYLQQVPATVLKSFLDSIKN
ncbi:sigma-70 family RNA polymerase sigma factor [Biomaibacter acetigenes]|uniref:Sigma-70 family RNA polymerase sigma factor n=1 Tax=Biomaibacter acetigenes TaxID=2316383 RepID=A0A3G2R509_9FIRM|nr:sigma factor-like helix-turn-helix DNA-binding protein [Biomaibacter acetigenes]AYO30614.1 sigma-70 family RNA polymerase sigma factor [Biomaibacter acetigenes]